MRLGDFLLSLYMPHALLAYSHQVLALRILT